MVYSIIQKFQLEGARRLDAEYYQPEYLEKARRLISFKTLRLEQIANITDGEHGSPIWDENSGIKYFSAQHVRDCLIDDSNVKTISEIIDKRNKRSHLRKGDILLSTVGTIGFAGIVTEDLVPANIDRHVARITIKEKTLDPEFLVAFLNSSYGRFQTIREATGNIQLNLFIDKIKGLKVPRVNNPAISQLLKSSLQAIEETEGFYSQAENLLLEELGLKDFQPEDDLSFVVNLSDVQSARRADAEYFQPKYEKLILKIKTATAKLLPEVIDDVATKFNPQSKPDVIFHYVELANVNLSTGVIDGSSEILGKEAPSRAKRLLKTGDVIASSVEGSLRKVALVSEEQKDYLASTGFFQFRSKLILPEVLLVLGKSIVLQMQLEKQCAGTILTAVPQDSLKNILIPILPIETQKEIADLVRRSHDARRKSKALLEQAKREVEEMIEKTI